MERVLIIAFFSWMAFWGLFGKEPEPTASDIQTSICSLQFKVTPQTYYGKGTFLVCVHNINVNKTRNTNAEGARPSLHNLTAIITGNAAYRFNSRTEDYRKTMTFELTTSYFVRDDMMTENDWETMIECSTFHSKLRFLELDDYYKMNWFERKLRDWILNDCAKELSDPICNVTRQYGSIPNALYNNSTLSSFNCNHYCTFDGQLL